jgi:hypothetical protein
MWMEMNTNELLVSGYCSDCEERTTIVADAVHGWQPIETAPKGRHILYVPEVRFRARGVDKKAFLPEMIRIDFYPVAWPRKPTHWMPLPPPPAQERS